MSASTCPLDLLPVNQHVCRPARIVIPIAMKPPSQIFLNTNRRECVEKRDRVRSCLVELQSFSLSELQIGNSTLSCSVGSTRVPPESPWMAPEIQEMFGRIRVQAVLKPFLRSSSFRQEVIQTSNGDCEVPANFALNFSAKSSILTTPSSSR